MSDEEFAVEVVAFKQAKWRESRLLAHARDHRDDFARVLGKPLDAKELDELSGLAIRLWDKLLTGLGIDNSVVYHFVRSWSEFGGIIVVVVRGTAIRTCVPFDDFSEWLESRPEMVEVTDCPGPDWLEVKGRNRWRWWG